jgi:hypothetical protein
MGAASRPGRPPGIAQIEEHDGLIRCGADRRSGDPLNLLNTLGLQASSVGLRRHAVGMEHLWNFGLSRRPAFTQRLRRMRMMTV